MTLAKIDVIAIFPEIIRSALEFGILRRAIDRKLLAVELHNLRDFTRDRHASVDDYSYGGGSGMILKPEPIFRAIEALSPEQGTPIIFLTPQGTPFTQRISEKFSLEPRIILLCGRYKGVDERVRKHLITDEISIGDYVLSGGEIPALVLIDSIARILPGSIGDYSSAQADSFSGELLDHPHYTRPADFNGMKVPEVLLGGNHEKILQWRREQSIERTGKCRPDLLR